VFTRRRIAAALAAIGLTLATAAAIGTTVPPASANSPGCSLTNHCYSVLLSGSQSSTLYQGMYGTWNRAAMGAGCDSSNHRFIDSEMWFAPFSGGWVEGGDTAGWLAPGGSCDYYAFAAWMREDQSGYAERNLARLNHNDSVTDEFQISRSASTNHFYVYFNGSRVETAGVQFWNSRRFEMGGEVATAYATSDMFDMFGRAIDADGTRHLLPAPKSTSVDDPPLYGSHPNDSEWKWRVRP